MVRGFKKNTFGANDYLVAFGGGRAEAVELKDAAWRVDCGAQFGVPALDATVKALLRRRYPHLKPMTDATIREAVKAFYEEGGGKADFLHSPNAEARYGPVAAWDVSRVTNMRELLCQCHCFAADVSGWDVTAVRDMFGLFMDCLRFTANLSAWRVGAGTDTYSMFYGARAFDRKGAPWADDEAF